ncbi:MAG TPA: hypothetical protein VN034_09425 [Sphingopyxis sp.]|nr:hypothetical protein [Sphingopyxis sp.]
MGVLQNMDVASDRVFAALVAGLELEFGRGAGAALAQRFLDAEEVDFHWDARVQERWIGAYEGCEDGDVELDRIAILGRLAGDYFVATMIVDGDGKVQGMMGRYSFGCEIEARKAFLAAS